MNSLKQGTLYLFDFLALIILWRCLAFLIRQYFTRRTTVLYDLASLGRPRSEHKRIKGTAVVCGGSFSGLWSARFLADHFEDVLLVDPEEWLATPEGCTPVYDEAGELVEGRREHPRSRVYQYDTTHAFLPITYAVLKMLWPSVDDEIRKTDGRVGESDYRTYLLGKKLLHTPKGANGENISNFYMSREGLERMLRRLIIRNTPRIRWMVGTVKGVQTEKNDVNTLSSVVIRLPDNSERILPAALVVDCTGTSQAGLKWLKRVYAEADKSTGSRLALNDPRLRISYYTNQQTRTFCFPIPAEKRNKLPIPGGYESARWLYTFTPILGKGRKSVFIDRLEGHRIRIMVGTWGDLPLPQLDELREFFDEFNPLETVPKWLLDLIDALLEFKDQAGFVTSKYPTLSWIQYEKAAYIPSNFVAVGDSVMQPNPTFGQGCAKALIGAIALDSALRSRSAYNSTRVPDGFGARYFKEQAQKTAVVWRGTKSLDYLHPTTIPAQGEKLSDEYWAAKFTASAMLLSQTDNYINDVIYRAINFLSPSVTLMHPYILAKVLLLWTRQRLGLAPDVLQN